MAKGRVVTVFSVYDDLTNISRKLVSKYKLSKILGTAVVKKGQQKVVYVNYKLENKDDVDNVVEYMSNIGYRGGVDYDAKREDLIIGVQGNSKVRVNFIPSKPLDAKNAVLPPAIQEKGTTVIFNRVLIDNKSFAKEEDIMKDPTTAKKLKEVFKEYEYRLPDWIHTYYQQQKQFLKIYKNSKWDKFVYEGNDFVTFFRKNLPRVVRDPLTQEKVGDYTTWNPSDIWAAYDLKAVQDEIKQCFPIDPQNVVQLNNILAKLMDEKKLVGISLKKVQEGKEAKIKLVNDTESHKVLTEIEILKLKGGIKFDIDNLFTETENTRIIYGSGMDQYFVNVRRAGNNLGFATAIKRTPAAQGGLAPTEMVVKLLNEKASNVTFNNKNQDYPQSAEAWDDLPVNEFKKYKTWFDFVKKHSTKPNVEFLTFYDLVLKYYKDGERGKKLAIAKLLSLNFWYDSLNNHKNNKEFWKDLLYLGLKIGNRGKFAPHAKIS